MSSQDTKIEIDFEALFQLAQERNEVEMLENNLFNLYLLNRNHYDVRRLFHNRLIHYQTKLQILEKIFGPQTSKLFYMVVYLLIEHKMMHKIYYAYEGFSRVANQKLNRMMIQLHTSILLNSHDIQGIQEKLESIFNKQIKLIHLLDSDLIGGMYLKLPNGEVYDFSYQKQLLDLKYFLT